MDRRSEKITMLVADDDPAILSYFRSIIKDPRYILHLVSSGIQAVAKAQQNKIDLAFLDINMPELNGIETLIRWKKIQPATQIVMISSYSDGNLVADAIQKGAFTYLFKPLNKMDIFSVTVKCLNQAGVQNVSVFK